MKILLPHEWMVRGAQRGASECRECGQRGFTLVELMIALTLSIFLIGAVILTFISGRGASLEAEQLARTQENLRFASDFLIRDIRNAGFRDQLTLHYPQYLEIGRCFAKYGNVGRSLAERLEQPCSSTGDNERLTIRYAGRGACGLAFQDDNELKLIENTYFVLDGELLCEGKEIGFEPGDGDDVGDLGEFVELGSGTEVLASGLTGVSFTFLFPDSGPPANVNVCNYSDVDALDDACIGVEIEMSFDGARERSATLMAAFRNVVLDRLFSRE